MVAVAVRRTTRPILNLLLQRDYTRNLVVQLDYIRIDLCQALMHFPSEIKINYKLNKCVVLNKYNYLRLF